MLTCYKINLAAMCDFKILAMKVGELLVDLWVHVWLAVVTVGQSNVSLYLSLRPSLKLHSETKSLL